MTELTQDNLKEILEKNSNVVVQYGAAWCGNCRILKPKFKKLAEEHQDVAFVYVDAEKFPQARQYAKVDNLPTFASFKGGSLVKQAQGNKIDLVKELVDEITSN